MLCACPEVPAEEVEAPPCWVWGPLVAAVAAVAAVEEEEEDLLMWAGTKTE